MMESTSSMVLDLVVEVDAAVFSEQGRSVGVMLYDKDHASSYFETSLSPSDCRLADHPLRSTCHQVLNLQRLATVQHYNPTRPVVLLLYSQMNGGVSHERWSAKMLFFVRFLEDGDQRSGSPVQEEEGWMARTSMFLRIAGAPSPGRRFSFYNCTSRKVTRYCKFEHVEYVRDALHGRIEVDGGDGAEVSSLPPRLLLVHALQCCPQWHFAVPVEHVRRQAEQQCDLFIAKDAYMFGVLNIMQYGHLLHETFFALFHTILTFSGSDQQNLEESVFDDVILISDVIDADKSLKKFSFLLSTLSNHPWFTFSTLRTAGRRVCFRQLVVGLSDGMNMFATEETVKEDKTSSPIPNYRDVQMLRSRVLKFVETAGRRRKSGGERVVAFVHRSEELTSRRGIFNLDQLVRSVESLNSRVMIIEFEKMSLVEQVEVVQDVDALVGVTGTGLWNALWMRRGAAGIQIFPFGVGYKGGREFENAIRYGPGEYRSIHCHRFFKNNIYTLKGESCGPPRGCSPDELLPPHLSYPAIAFTDPEGFWRQDWKYAWSTYYGQDAIVVDAAALEAILVSLRGVDEDEDDQSWEASDQN
uniref:Glycosyltransferase 61 catalytic domain-containing protein n=1 Tax=Guillardia theta TaxID=55529 RepID=A0A6U6CLT3_GUITH